MHSGSKPFACDQSEYSNTRRHPLKTHKLTHSGKKSFACDQCEYSSTQAQALKKRHKLTHSEDRPHAATNAITPPQRLRHSKHKMIHKDKTLSHAISARSPFHATYANILPLKH